MIGHYLINRLEECDTLFCRSDLLVAPTKKLKNRNDTLSIRNGIITQVVRNKFDGNLDLSFWLIIQLSWF